MKGDKVRKPGVDHPPTSLRTHRHWVLGRSEVNSFEDNGIGRSHFGSEAAELPSGSLFSLDGKCSTPHHHPAPRTLHPKPPRLAQCCFRTEMIPPNQNQVLLWFGQLFGVFGGVAFAKDFCFVAGAAQAD